MQRGIFITVYKIYQKHPQMHIFQSCTLQPDAIKSSI